MFSDKEEMSDEKRAMIVIGIFIIFLVAFMAIVVVMNMPAPVKPDIPVQNITQNATFIRNVTMVR